jgi:hypothetical protein
MLDAQWRDTVLLLAYRCGGSAGIALGPKLERAPASRFIPLNERSQGHLKPAQYRLGIELLSIVQEANKLIKFGYKNKSFYNL